MKSLRFVAQRLVFVALLTLMPVTAAAQDEPPPPLPSDALFNPDVLHRVDLRLHSADWEKLKQNFQENTYYPADFVWNGNVVRTGGS